MTISKVLLSVVLARLRGNAIPGIKPSDILCLPEGRIPAVAGQKIIVVHPHRLVTINPGENYKKRRVEFDISVVRRIRDIPNDRFDLIYTQDDEMANTHEVMMPLIESIDLLMQLQAAATGFSITRGFSHLNNNLDPIHLYPGYFLSSDKSSDKIAGYRTYSRYISPVFISNTNPLGC